MWNEGVIIFFKSTRFPLHQSTRLPAHYQLTLLKLYFTAWLLASVYECEISGLKLTQKYHQSGPWRNSLCLNWKSGCWVHLSPMEGRVGHNWFSPWSHPPSPWVLLSAVTAPPPPGPAFPAGMKSWRHVADALGTLGISHPSFISR